MNDEERPYEVTFDSKTGLRSSEAASTDTGPREKRFGDLRLASGERSRWQISGKPGGKPGKKKSAPRKSKKAPVRPSRKRPR